MSIKNRFDNKVRKGSSLIEYTFLTCLALTTATSFGSAYSNMLKNIFETKEDALSKKLQRRIIKETVREINGRIIYDNRVTYTEEA